ncbi:hypothetical protein TNCT_145191 [Trichonephila clavata]|uniref:Uncharacterized protein n=1 Tax=Trichonephila clavata TaxID=2740835 RepID=A0A8X6HPJ4_TRICU|nr:hypothetical protein TNCT_145191 [Trichonephila clavata]
MERGGVAADTECIKGGNTSCRTLITAFSNSPKSNDSRTEIWFHVPKARQPLLRLCDPLFHRFSVRQYDLLCTSCHILFHGHNGFRL